ncbi:MAG: hypothetical protein IAE78_00845 [Myxococcus sp.]|nr:hypothetical protein [Myxococcus sp.]
MALRWAFPDPAEVEARSAIEQRIDAWWSSVRAGRSRGAPPDADALAAIAPGLQVEVRRKSLIISPDGERRLLPLARRVIARAPADLELQVLEARPPELVDEAIARARQKTGLDPSAWTVQVEPQEHGLLALRWRAPRVPDGAAEAAIVSSLALLGEPTLPDWVSSVTVEPRPSMVSRLLGAGGGALAELPRQLARAQAEWLARQADQPLLVSSRAGRDANWKVVTLSPPADSDGAGQRDLERARTANVDLFKAARSGVPFASARFSRFGETFLYVKTDGFGDDGFSNTLALEEALDRALSPDQLGRAIGAGTGTRYSYVDLVVKDVPRALERMLPVLRAGRLPTRAWVLFFDDTYADEWVGVWPRTEPPPSFRASK